MAGPPRPRRLRRHPSSPGAGRAVDAAGVDVVIVGPGAHFLSGISHYTACLVGALSSGPQGLAVAALLLRRLCPRALYPGRRRVGAQLADLPYPPDVAVYDGLDYYWGPSLLAALRFLHRARPQVLVLQWWTASAAHSYLLLSWWARRRGARVVVEFHEVLDVGEAAVPLVPRYADAALRRLLRGGGAVVHSAHDAAVVTERYRLHDRPVVVVPHGPYGHLHSPPTAEPPAAERTEATGGAPTTTKPCRLLFFGVIRPYKGLEELAAAFHSLIADGFDLELMVVGEVWQGYRTPLQALDAGPGSGRVRIVEGYVPDAEVGRCFAEADLVVLPYRRSSASGPLHVAMSHGLPVVTTAVGGLVEATAGYTGAVLVPPGDPVALAEGIRLGLTRTGHRHADVASWDRTRARFAELCARLDVPLQSAPAASSSGLDPVLLP